MSDEEKLISHYRLKTLLRKDGFGAVYLAEDTRDQKGCVLRVVELDHPTLTRITGRVRSHAQRDHPLIERIRQRMKRISELKNSHILPVIEFGEEHIQGNNDIIFYMVSPHEKESLLSFWSEQTSKVELIAPEVVSELISQAADALFYVHRRSLVHQYVRLSSFMLRSTARSHRLHLYLTDFWFADISAAILEEGQISQDLSVYLASEQLAGHAVPASDQYALAILAYELLLGYRLSQVDLSLGLYERLLRQRGVEVSAAEMARARRIDLALLRALAEDASARYKNIEEFASAFRAAVSGELIELDEDTARLPVIAPAEAQGGLAAGTAGTLVAGELLAEAAEARVQTDDTTQGRHSTLHKTLLTSEGREAAGVEEMSAASGETSTGETPGGAELAGEEGQERSSTGLVGAAGFAAGLAAGELLAGGLEGAGATGATAGSGGKLPAGDSDQTYPTGAGASGLSALEEAELIGGTAAAGLAAAGLAGESSLVGGADRMAENGAGATAQEATRTGANGSSEYTSSTNGAYASGANGGAGQLAEAAERGDTNGTEKAGAASRLAEVGIIGAGAGLAEASLAAEAFASSEISQAAGGGSAAAGGASSASAAGIAGAGASTEKVGSAAGGLVSAGGATSATGGAVTGAVGAGLVAGEATRASGGGLTSAGRTTRAVGGGIIGGGMLAASGKRRRRRGGRALLVAIIIALLLVMAFGSVIAFALNMSQSTATVTLTLESHTIQNTYLVTATTTTASLSGQVQANFLTQNASLSQSGQTTGYYAGARASGFIKFYNSSTGCGCPIVIPAGTTFTGASGVTVVTDETAAVASLCSVTVHAHAAGYGPAGNIPANDVHAAYNSKITATNPFAFSGGQTGQSNALVQQSDIDHLATALKAKAIQSAQAGIQAQVKSNQRLFASPACKTQVQSDHAAGDYASSVSVTVSAVCTAEAYDYSSAVQIVQQQVQSEASSYSSDEYVLLNGLQTSVSSATVTNVKTGTILLAIKAFGKWVRKLSGSLEQSLSRVIAGKSVADARAILSQIGVAHVDISVTGRDTSTLPSDSSRIKIQLKS